MTQCDCSREPDAYNDVEHTTWRKARQRHGCVECHDWIEPGQRYEYYTALCDGSWYHSKTCAICARIRKDYNVSGWCVGELDEALEYCVGVGL